MDGLVVRLVLVSKGDCGDYEAACSLHISEGTFGYARNCSRPLGFSAPEVRGDEELQRAVAMILRHALHKSAVEFLVELPFKRFS